jgi:SAM-dependent methyltransferase
MGDEPVRHETTHAQYAEPDKYDARASLHLRFAVSPNDWPHWCFDQLELPGAASVLDVGCGPGWLWAENADRVPAAWRVVLADSSPAMVQAARRRLGAAFSYEVATVSALPHPDAGFDAVVANHMLYHVADRPRAIAELRRVLRPGGRLLAGTNGEGHLREIDEVAFRWGGTAEACIDLDFSLENGEEQLARAFPAVELRPFEDRLDVTDPEAVVRYIASLPTWDTDVDLDGVRRDVSAAIEQQGSFRITKVTGLFVATAPG